MQRARPRELPDRRREVAGRLRRAVGDDVGLDPAAGLDALRGALVADRAHEVLHRREVALGRLVVAGGVRLRVARDDQLRRALRVRSRLGEALPDLLGDERHEGVQQPQHPVEDVRGHGQRDAVALAHTQLGELQVPVGELVPEEVACLAQRLGELVGAQQLVGEADRALQPREHPAVLAPQPRVAHRRQLEVRVGPGERMHEARGVPQLVREVAASLDAVVGDALVVAWAGAGDQRVAQRVRAVLLDHAERVDDVAEGLRHLAPVGRAHEAVQVDRLEGDVAALEAAHVVEREHDHAGDPEEDDVVARLHHLRRVEAREVVRVLVRPAQRRVRPEARGEPSVEGVLVLPQRTVAGPAGVGILDGGDGLAAVPGLAVPDGDAVAPPDLAADAPVADVLHPVQVGALEALRHEGDAAVAHRRDRRLGERPDVHPPLLRDDRLHHRARALRVPDRVRVRLDLLDQPLRLEVLDDTVARLEAVDAGVAPGVLVERAVGREDVDRLEPVPLADLEVDRVVAGRHLERAGPRLDLDRLVGDDRDRAVRGRLEHHAPDQVTPALVLGMHGHGGVGRDRLRPRRRDHDVVAWRRGGLRPLPLTPTLSLRGRGGRIAVLTYGGVADVPERGLDVAILDLEVGEGGLADGVPVDHPLAAEDQAILVEVHEGLANRALARLVERERLAVPVRRCAEPAVLLGDPRARRVDEVPDTLEEGLAADVVAAHALLVELALDERIDGDRGVVDAGHPDGVVAEHAMPADQGVLDGGGEGVAHVQLAGEVGRRHDHGEGAIAALRLEEAALFPAVVDALLDLGGVVGAAHLLAGAVVARHRCSLGSRPRRRASKTPPKRGVGDRRGPRWAG